MCLTTQDKEMVRFDVGYQVKSKHLLRKVGSTECFIFRDATAEMKKDAKVVYRAPWFDVHMIQEIGKTYKANDANGEFFPPVYAKTRKRVAVDDDGVVYDPGFHVFPKIEDARAFFSLVGAIPGDYAIVKVACGDQKTSGVQAVPNWHDPDGHNVIAGLRQHEFQCGVFGWIKILEEVPV